LASGVNLGRTPKGGFCDAAIRDGKSNGSKGSGAGAPLCSSGRQQCTIDLTLKAQRRQYEGLRSLGTVNSKAAPGHFLPVATGGFGDARLGAPPKLAVESY